MMWMIWSNIHGMWWCQDGAGYTQFIQEAGRFPEEHARLIVKRETCDGLLMSMRTDPVSGREYDSYDTVMVASPEPG